MVYGENEGEVFLGRSVTAKERVEATMQRVDQEIRKIIDQQYAVARKLLEDNRDKVEAMAKALLEMERSTPTRSPTSWAASRRVRQAPPASTGPSSGGTTANPDAAPSAIRRKTSIGPGARGVENLENF
jgi:cell division protease FtsH